MTDLGHRLCLRRREFGAELEEAAAWCGLSAAQKMAVHWGLSYEGAVWHAKNVDLISAEDAAELNRRQGKRTLISTGRFENETDEIVPSMVHSDLPEQASPLMSGGATLLVIEALEASVISVGRARELLLLGVSLQGGMDR